MKNIALFLLDRASMRGITLGKKIDKMAVRASETGEILLDDVEVPGRAPARRRDGRRREDRRRSCRRSA